MRGQRGHLFGSAYVHDGHLVLEVLTERRRSEDVMSGVRGVGIKAAPYTVAVALYFLTATADFERRTFPVSSWDGGGIPRFQVRWFVRRFHHLAVALERPALITY